MAGLSLGFKVRNPYVVATISTIGGMLFGFDISSVSAFIDVPVYKSYFKNPQATRQSGITAAMPAGSFAGSLASGWLSDRFGRKATIQLAAFIWMVGAAIQSSSQNVAQLVAGRTIAGVAIGLASSQVPVYIAELSPKKIRGRLVGGFQWAVTWGILIMFYISYGCSKINGTAAFRIAWGIQIVPGLLLFLGTMILDESPRWLASKDRWEEAINIVAHVEANGNVDDENVRIEIEEIKEAIRVEKNAKAGFTELFRGPVNCRRTFVGIFCQIWQQMCGMNVMMYYVVRVFRMAGYTGDAQLISSSIQYVINVVMTVPTLLFLDSWGRRPVLIFGAIAMMSWLWASAGIFASYATPMPQGLPDDPSLRMLIPDNQKAASKAAIAVSYLFVASFAPTWGPTAWVYVSEIFPMEQRAVANGVCAAANWAFNFAISMFTLPSFETITWKTYCIYASCCAAMAIHVFLMFPETKGKTLEEVDALWHANVPAWRSSKWVPTVPDMADINAVNGGRAPDMYKPTQQHQEQVGGPVSGAAAGGNHSSAESTISAPSIVKAE